MSLRARLAGVVALGATAVLALGSLALYWDLSGEVSDAITAELEVRVADLDTALAGSGTPTDQSPVVGQTVDERGSVLAPEGMPRLLTDEELAIALERELLVDRAVPGVGRRARLLAHRIHTEGDEPVVGVAATSTAPLEGARNRLLAILLVAGPGLIGAITFTAWMLVGAALRPVQRMAARAQTISMSAPGERLPQSARHDEIARLGRTLNQMLARIEATIGHERSFIDDASHELRTPLAALRGELELALDDLGDPEAIAAGLRSALEETDRLARLSENLLTLARADAGQLPAGSATTDLLVAARAAVARVTHCDEIEVTVAGGPAIVRGDADRIERIIVNLLTNAVTHARRRVSVEVSAAHRGAQLLVADDGPGFPPELLPVVFERFTRADCARGRGGTGLGLAIVISLVATVGGDVRARNGPPLGGACIDVTFPPVRP
jgi:two-component system OmpR family sensor kinase